MRTARTLTTILMAIAAMVLFPSSSRADVVIPGTASVDLTSPSGEPGLCCKYDLTVKAGSLEVLGVIVGNAFGAFGIGPGSPIAAPADWEFIPPLDAGAPDLFYFATTANANIKPKNSLSGFIYVSNKKVESLTVGLVVEGGVQQVTVPEPSSLCVLLCFGLCFGAAALALGHLRQAGFTK